MIERMSRCLLGWTALAALGGCRTAAPPAPAAAGPMPVAVVPVSFNAVPTGETYVATIKSRRSATIQPQVDGNLTRIFVTSGQAVKAGQILMQIDPLKQVAAVQQQVGTQAQSNAVYKFNQAEVDAAEGLFDAGVTSKQAYDTAVQNFESSQARLRASAAGTDTQKQQLAYYQIRAPFAGVIGDIPVHQGDYVSPTTMLTTLDENSGLEAYIYVPTERATMVKQGLPVEILDTDGSVLAKSTVSFLSPQVDNSLQGILAKAEIPAGSAVRNQQVVNARVTWTVCAEADCACACGDADWRSVVCLRREADGDGISAHLVPVTVGDTVGNSYPVLSGLKSGDQVIVSGLQFLGEGAPVKPMAGPPGNA